MSNSTQTKRLRSVPWQPSGRQYHRKVRILFNAESGKGITAIRLTECPDEAQYLDKVRDFHAFCIAFHDAPGADLRGYDEYTNKQASLWGLEGFLLAQIVDRGGITPEAAKQLEADLVALQVNDWHKGREVQP